MKKGLLALAALLVVICPSIVNAEEKDFDENKNEIVAQGTKYYKTVTNYDNLSLYSTNFNSVNKTSSYTVEVSEEEYNNASTDSVISTKGDGLSETTYKKLTSYISANGSYYQYKAILNWKTMPYVRSYDIIGIGMDSTVKVASSVYFNQYYCMSGGSCYTSYTHTPKTGTYGAGTSFKLAEGSLSTLRATVYFNVSKAVTSTIYGLNIYGDYSHATSNISLENSQKYTMNTGGISLNSSISGYYDSMQSAQATWSGSW